LHAAEEGARAFFRAGRQFGSAEIAHHERVTSEPEPWLVGAGSIGDQEGDVLGGVSRRMQDRDQDVAPLSPFSRAAANLGRALERGAAVLFDKFFLT
jgi:hypothetical protein